MHISMLRVSRLRLLYMAAAILPVLVAPGCRQAIQPASASPSPAAQAPASTGAGQSEQLQPGDTTRSLTHAGLPREYVMHVPPGYDAARPTPLVLAFHGISLDAGEMARISHFNEQADASGFIVVYPNGTGESKSWNGGHCCGEAAKNRVDDVGFTRLVIADVAGLANIDAKRVYATGFSNGAIFVYRLACELSDQIAAIGPIGATQVLNDEQACNPGRAVPIIHFHGTADRLNAYEGGSTAAGFEWVSVPQAMAYWADKNGCPADPRRTESGSIVHDMYEPCTSNATVELYTVTGGEHAWPGGEAVSAEVGEPTMEISATPLMWEFFAAHPLP